MANLLVVEGGPPLEGEVVVSGSKNAALPILAASLLTDHVCELKHIPHLKDIRNMVEIMRALGVRVERQERDSFSLNPKGLKSGLLPGRLVSRLRASYYLWGVLLARVGYVKSQLPGGCSIGNRPVDLHVKGFKALGAQTICQDGILTMWAKELRGSRVYLDYPSVGATINTLLAAVLAKGETLIENAAREPEVVDLSNFLKSMGAEVYGSGTDRIHIKGVKELKGAEHTIIPDRIEAGTFMLAAAVTRGDVYVHNVFVEHLTSVISKLREMGLTVEEDKNGVHVQTNGHLEAVDITTLPFPGYPTDLQAQGMVLLTQSKGRGQIQETVWEGRLGHVQELKKMGAHILMREGGASIYPGPLKGTRVKALDLRAGAALILAGLVASGRTEIEGCSHINRGYDSIYEKLQSLGASIFLEEKVPDPH